MDAGTRQRKMSRIEGNPELVSTLLQPRVSNDGLLKSTVEAEEYDLRTITAITLVNTPYTDKTSNRDDSLNNGQEHVPCGQATSSEGKKPSDSDNKVSNSETTEDVSGIVDGSEATADEDGSIGERKSSKSQPPKTSELEILLRKIKLRRYPKDWYTSVVPASDVEVRRRFESAKPQSPDRRRKLPRSSTSVTGATPKNKARPKTSLSTESKSSTRSKGTAASPPAVSVTTVLCHDPARSKTRRQLLEIAGTGRDNGLGGKPYELLQRRREDNRKNVKVLDNKVKDFLRTLEEDLKRQKAKDTLEF